ncbi:uncharacterized protein F5891DRAFT_1033786 [Suillus fuscotomentosus]|uniref:Uncharacterized protein n=1 Tax=Suillus fuscotomentosus TaxID=1912939 RepID=A0AAD4E6A0_9AGAM|nr:uncharacterized protein F5891DRAFT_1033786 [Suillus fuscotomentosus]KAG1900367.1 hypothetical protein F5891DRAFT_1033786 [Suillus fuscotomentosus]
MSLMLAMIAMLISGSSMIRWLHTDRQWTQEQLTQGDYFVWSYLLSIVTPIFFVVLSLNCFMFAILIAGFPLKAWSSAPSLRSGWSHTLSTLAQYSWNSCGNMRRASNHARCRQ